MTALPWTPDWNADWVRLTPEQRLGLECQYDGPIPHQAVLDELRRNSYSEEVSDA